MARKDKVSIPGDVRQGADSLSPNKNNSFTLPSYLELYSTESISLLYILLFKACIVAAFLYKNLELHFI